MNTRFKLFIKKRTADILRGKVTSGHIDQNLSDKVRKELFDLFDTVEETKLMPILLSAVLESEVEKFGSE